jgi:hypothetical protein
MGYVLDGLGIGVRFSAKARAFLIAFREALRLIQPPI